MLCGMKKSGLSDSAFSRPETGFWGYARKYLGDRAFQKSMFAIAGPICLHMLLVNGITLADTMMIGRLGETAVAAVGLGNQMFQYAFGRALALDIGTDLKLDISGFERGGRPLAVNAFHLSEDASFCGRSPFLPTWLHPISV